MSAADGLDWLAVPALAPELAEPLGISLARMDPWVTLGSSAESLARGLQTPHPDLTRHLALRQGELQGLAAVRAPWLRGAYIELFAVLPSAQGRGIGSTLMRHVEAHYGGHAANLWLLVSAFNHRARQFYARQGFCPIGILDDLVIRGQDEILMRKRLESGSERRSSRLPAVSSPDAR